MGIAAERAAIRSLTRKGYTEIAQVQNASGHGIDIVARNKFGHLRFFEVKGHAGVGRAVMNPQQRDIVGFVQSRLERAVGGTGHWRNVGEGVQDTAEMMLFEVQSGARIQGSVLNVDKATSMFPRVTASRW